MLAGALGKIIGTLGVELDTTFAHIRTQETNASNWIADVIRDGTGADVTILNSGTLRADEKIPPGPCTDHSSKERRRPLFWQPFWTVTEPAPGLLVPLSGILASRRRKPRKNEKKRGKNGRDMA